MKKSHKNHIASLYRPVHFPPFPTHILLFGPLPNVTWTGRRSRRRDKASYCSVPSVSISSPHFQHSLTYPSGKRHLSANKLMQLSGVRHSHTHPSRHHSHQAVWPSGTSSAVCREKSLTELWHFHHRPSPVTSHPTCPWIDKSPSLTSCPRDCRALDLRFQIPFI